MANRFLNNITINDEYTLPSADGTADQIIKTDGAGQLSFVDQSTINAGNAEHVVIYAKNTSGASISKGTPVYITGTVGATDTVEIAPANANDSTKMPAVGLLDDTLANNTFGYVITGGFMDNITTDPIDGVTPSSNDTVYVKSGGGLTLTKPIGANFIQNVAKVGKVSGGNSGSLIVSSILRTNDVPTPLYVDHINQRLGIGVTNPTNKLDVYGDLKLGTTGDFYISQSPFVTSTFYVRTASSGTVAFGAPASFQQNVSVQGDLYAAGGSISTAIGTKRFGTWSNRIVDTGNNYFNLQGGNFGIGTTSPSYTLDVNGVIRGEQYLRLKDTGGTNQFSIRAESTYGTLDNGSKTFNYVASNHLFLVGASEKMRITSGGNVGIGTTSPSQKLDVAGDATFDGRIYTNATALASVGILGKAIANGWAARYDSNNANYSGFYFDANNDASMILRDDAGNMNVYLRSDSTSYLNGGNVGIGTTSPSTKLHISDASTPEVRIQDTTNNRYLSLYQNNSNSYIQSSLNSPLVFSTHGSNERMRITTAGNVGIGTTSPSEKLHIYNGTAYVTPIAYAANQSAYALKVGAYNSTSFDMGLQAKSTSGGSPYMSFKTTSTDNVLTIWGDKVGIKTTPNLSYNLDINGTLRTVGDSYFDDDIHLGRYIFHAGDTNTWIGFPSNDTITLRTNNSDRVRVTSTGNVGVGTSTPLYLLDAAGTIRCTSLIQTSQSDKKENIGDIDKSKPKAIPFKEYRYKSNIDSTGRKRYGVLAEDIENDYPELVYVDSNGDKAVNYIDLLVKRVAELEKELEDISLTPGPKGDKGDTGAQGLAGANGKNGANGNDHLKNVQSINFNEKSGQLEITIEGYKEPFRFNPAK